MMKECAGIEVHTVGDTEGERVGTVQTDTHERAPVLKHKVVVSDLALVPAALSH